MEAASSSLRDDGIDTEVEPERCVEAVFAFPGVLLSSLSRWIFSMGKFPL